ncbi:hypothetical protein MASR2M78_37310 [Treponema sp.]
MTQRRSLRKTLLLTNGIIALFLVLILFAISLFVFSLRSLHNAQESYSALADEGSYLMGLFLDSVVSDLEQAGRIFRASRLEQGIEADTTLVIQELLRTLVDQGRFRTVLFADKDSTVLAAYPESNLEGFSLRNRPEASTLEGQIYRGRIGLNLEGFQTLPVAVRYKDILVIGELRLDWLQTLIDSLAIGRTGYALAADIDGTLVAHPDHTLVESRLNISNLSVVAEARAEGTSKGIFKDGGILRIGAAKVIDSWGWILLISSRLDDTLSAISSMALILAAGIIFCSLLFFISMQAAVKRILSPLSLLFEGVHKMSLGDYVALKEIPLSFIEIDSLASEFALMASKVADRNRLLQQSIHEKELLLREVHHRVKNNMQIISSMISLQRSAIQDSAVSNLFMEAERRVQSMAMIHERLYLSEDLASIELKDIVRELFGASIQSTEGTLEVVGDTVQLGLDQAVPCALALNELALNAVKHGCENNTECSIRVSILKSGKKTTITVEDSGPGLPDDFDPKFSAGLGMNIVQALTKQLKGTLIWGISSLGGAEFVLSFPFQEPAIKNNA